MNKRRKGKKQERNVGKDHIKKMRRKREIKPE